MSEISLNQYLAKLDALLDDHAYDEVIYHCRHILKHFPKNVATYRRLGHALLQVSRWQEAVEVLQRVLSVVPDDYDAHLGLSQAYHRLKRGDEAIWHLERAFEQDPNNRALIDQMREYYRDYRKIETQKINLTSGAVARQYARNNLYEQAIEVLVKSLEQSRERVDLRLLLARILQEADYTVEAAETALDVLERLPDCLEANDILAQLWIAEDRPSDAQRYLSRIEPVNPYYALELAQGEPPADDAFELPELDYQTVASRHLTSNNPDWLRQIDDKPGGDEAGASTEEGDIDFEDWGAADETDDFLASIIDSAPEPESWSDKFDAFPDLRIEEEDTSTPAPTPRKKTGLTGLLSTLKTDELKDPDAKAQPSDSQPAEAAAAIPAAVEDAVVAESAGGINLFDDDGDLPEDSGSDPLAWLTGSDAAPVAEEEPEQIVSSAAPANDASDPLAWLHASGVEVLDEDQQSAGYNPYAEEVDELHDPDQVDPMAWLKSAGVELTDDGEDEGAPLSALVDADAADEDDPLAWLKSAGVEISDDDDDAPAPAEKPAASARPAPKAEAKSTMDWLADESLLEEMLDMEALASGHIPTSLDDQLERPDDMPDDNKQDDDFSNWLDDGDEEQQSAELSDVEWLDGEPFARQDAEEDEPQPSQEVVNLFDDDSGDALDWMVSPEMESEASSADEDQFVFDEQVDAQAVPEEVAPVPNLFDDDEFDFEFEEEEAVAADSFEPQSVYDDQMISSDGDEDAFAWGEEAAEEEPAAVADDMPDWLSSVGEMEEDEEVEEAGYAVSESYAEPAVSFSEEEDAFAWGEEAAEEEPAAVADDMPDWLSSVGEMEEDEEVEEAGYAVSESYAEPAVSFSEEEDAFAWGEEAAEEEPAAVADDMPDWLQSSQPVEAGDYQDDFADDEDAWGEEDEYASEVEPTAESADWVSQIKATKTDEFAIEAPPDEGEAFDWLSVIDDSQSPAAEKPVSEQIAGDDFDTYDMDMLEVDEEQFETSPARNAPDWLNAMVPGLDVDYDAPEDEQVEREFLKQAESRRQAKMASGPRAESDFDWLEEIVNEETGQPVSLPEATGRRRFTFSRPPAWLRRDSDTSAMPDEIGDELPPWLQYDDE